MASVRIRIASPVPGEVIGKCRDIISSGGVVVYPTDTLYALGADPHDPAAVNRLFTIKERDPDQPILLLLSGREDVAQWADDVTPAALRLMERFWPGPLTLVLRARKDVLPRLTGGAGTIGLRVPGNALTREVLRGIGMALTGTSANRSRGPAPLSADDIEAALGDRVDLILDAGPAAGEEPSTVVDVSRGAPRILRQGAIRADQIMP